MTLPRVEFHFDFGSPNAYLSHKIIPAIQERTGVTFEYVPVLLGGLFKLANNRSPAESNADIPNKRAYERLEMERFIAAHRISAFQRNSHFPVNTLKIMRGAVAAMKLGCHARYVDEVFKCMWEKGLNMADDEVIVGNLTAAGLDAPQLMATAQDPDVKSQLISNTESSHARGAFGSPTFFVNEEMYFGKDRLRDVEEEILRRTAA